MDCGDVLVLCYHAVAERATWKHSVGAAQLERQLAFLLERGYRGRTFADAVLAPEPGRTLCVTFDDGYRSVAELAFPILSRVGVPATVFAVTRAADTGGRVPDGEDASLRWDDLRALAAAGWEVGSHTRSHPALTSLDDSQLAAELAGSREDCEERLGVRCRSLAYPYGDFDDRVVRAARAAGYLAAAAFPPRFPAPQPLTWPRVGVYRDDGPLAFRLKVSPRVRRLRTSPVWPAVRAVHAVATGVMR